MNTARNPESDQRSAIPRFRLRPLVAGALATPLVYDLTLGNALIERNPAIFMAGMAAAISARGIHQTIRNGNRQN